MKNMSTFSRSLVVVILCWAVSPPLQAQVVVYPVVAVDQVFTSGTYRDASQEKISHYGVRISFIDHWNSAWTGGYRRTGIAYTGGFEYLQNQFLLSKGHSFVVGSNLLSLRSDLVYTSSNSALTDKSVTFYGGLWYHLVASNLILGVQAQGNLFKDVRTMGVSGSVSGGIGTGGWLTGRVNVDRFADDIGHGQTLLSTNVSYYHSLSHSVGMLLTGKYGRRSLYYEPDIFLLYNTFDAHRAGGGFTVFVAPWPWGSLFADISYDRFSPVAGGTYSATYYSIGGRLAF